MRHRNVVEPPGLRRSALLLTCEHAGNDVPDPYRQLFSGYRSLLDSHRGLDIGAAATARELRQRLGAPLIAARFTRLLVDLNRSAGHRALLSEVTRTLPSQERRQLLALYYHPYRELVRRWIEIELRRSTRVLHVSVHSFVPVLAGKRRDADVGLLYDPARSGEAKLCRAWQTALAACGTGWKVRRNYPYRGTSDGQVVDLRRSFPPQRYLGIELEINQASLVDPARRRRLFADLSATLPR